MPTERCTASVWPHRHTDEFTGPLDVVISYRNQPPTARGWPKKQPVWVQLSQPDERTNLTIMRLRLACVDGVQWLQDGYEGQVGRWYRVNQYRIKRNNSLKFYIKSRVTNQMEHPIPRGRWEGTYQHDNTSCIFTLQAMTMKVQKEEPRIVLPDGFSPGENRIVTP